MNELLVIAWLLLPCFRFADTILSDTKTTEFAVDPAAFESGRHLFYRTGGCIVCFFPDYIYKGADGRRSASKLMTSLVFISRIYSWKRSSAGFYNPVSADTENPHKNEDETDLIL